MDLGRFRFRRGGEEHSEAGEGAVSSEPEGEGAYPTEDCARERGVADSLKDDPSCDGDLEPASRAEAEAKLRFLFPRCRLLVVASALGLCFSVSAGGGLRNALARATTSPLASAFCAGVPL